MDIQAIHNEAKTAAIQAENAYLSQHGEPLYCGFAWVDVFVERTNSKEAKELLKIAVDTRKNWSSSNASANSLIAQGGRKIEKIVSSQLA